MADSKHQAAQMASSRFAENTKTLIALLDGVDFLHSRLPKKILEDLHPETGLCKLEHSTRRYLTRMLKQDAQKIQADARPLDEKLIVLAQLFGQYVRNGDPTAVQITHAALLRGISQIRCKFPHNPAVSHETFISVNAEYLSQWLHLVQWAEIYDRQSTNLASQRKTHQLDEEQLEQTIDRVRDLISTDPDSSDAFSHILNHDSVQERANWTEAQRNMHLLLVNHRLDQLTLQLSNSRLNALEQSQLATRQKITALWQQLSAVPIVTDPNLMNKYRESMDQIIHDLAANDAFVEEALHYADELEAAMKHLDQTPAALRQRDAVAEAARSKLAQMHTADQAAANYSTVQQDSHSNNHN